MTKLLPFLLFVFSFFQSHSQLVEVQADYNAVGDCIFSAHNNTQTPLFLNLDFADLQNTTFNETLPYIKMLRPGFNSLFTLQRDMEAGVPRFNYQLKTYRSNPAAIVDLDFPYLVPFAPGTTISPFDVDNIDGFWGSNEPKSWVATGFKAQAGMPVFASRKGEIVEISGAERSGEPQSWYNAWPNSITVLQPDGTLICYKNISVDSKMLQLGETVYPGQPIGEIARNESELVVLIYQNTLSSPDLLFIIPQFVTTAKQLQIVNPSMHIEVVHPLDIRGLEMSKREKRKYLK